ncbi:discoidin domain-containing protein [Tamlana agarivorans]|uniref:Discoidin domain-containing protein n=1 Tax=Pseudotamlana agarivorans TaxID=481183 RepID=A0ACC5UB99_9FLAO|nr:discoidin domain-containing protein [Tamlana agarivorans]MBU2951460.1 discoidin domain-containing protein [Tamlana agarivorans]
MKTKSTFRFSAFILMALCINFLTAQNDPNLGIRADWMRGAWGLNWKPVYYTNDNVERAMSIEPFLEQIDHLETIDYIQLHLSESYIYSACHTAPHDILESLWRDDMVDGSPVNLVVPRASSGKDPFKDWLLAVKAKGLKTQIYVNSGQLLWDLPDEIVNVKLRWKQWCNNNAADFINSESYHTDSAYPDRQYMFCYAEYILKEYSERYGDLIDAWIFDTASYMTQNGDDGDSANVNDQRIFEAFANAARAGNANAAVSFNRGVGEREAPGSPFASPTLFDDYTFGHPFGGAGDMTYPEVLYDYNYRVCTWMSDYDGYAFREDNVSWNDNIVGHFDPKMSTTAWNRGATPCLTNDEFVEWNAEGLINGGAISWGAPLIFPFMNRDADATLIMHDYAVEQLTLMDEYLQENQKEETPTVSGGNLALNGTATQSSTSNNGSASRAIDGNTNGKWSAGSVTHTDTEDNAWWELYLDSESTVEEIVIYNRTDCCEDRLSDFVVFMWDEAGNRTLRKFITTAPDGSLSIDVGGLAGYRIRIKSNLAATALSLAEVEVYGTRNLALNGTATQSSTANGGAASRAIDGNTNGAWSSGSVTHTSAEDGAWWALDLDGEYNIGEIKIYNRTDACCTERLSSFTLFIWDSNGNRTLRNVNNTTPDPYITIDAGGVLGKSIRINSNLTGTALSLAEVEVYSASSASTAKAADSKIGASNDAVSTSLKVYPNPVNNVFTVQTPHDSQENVNYSVFNNLGQAVLNGSFKGNSTPIDASELKAGMYFLRVYSGEKTYTKKIVKQ